MRVLVCGSREWTDAMVINAVLDSLHCEASSWNGGFTLIEGQCPVGHGGADRIAAAWAKGTGCEHLPFPGKTRNGRFQGPERNQRMLDEGKPDVVIAFKDGFQRDRVHPLGATLDKAHGGTEDMVRRAKAAGIPTYIVSHG